MWFFASRCSTKTINFYDTGNFFSLFYNRVHFCDVPSSPKKPTAYFENISEKEGELASGLYCKKKGRKREKNERELPDSRKWSGIKNWPFLNEFCLGWPVRDTFFYSAGYVVYRVTSTKYLGCLETIKVAIYNMMAVNYIKCLLLSSICDEVVISQAYLKRCKMCKMSLSVAPFHSKEKILPHMPQEASTSNSGNIKANYRGTHHIIPSI